MHKCNKRFVGVGLCGDCGRLCRVNRRHKHVFATAWTPTE